MTADLAPSGNIGQARFNGVNGANSRPDPVPNENAKVGLTLRP